MKHVNARDSKLIALGLYAAALALSLLIAPKGFALEAATGVPANVKKEFLKLGGPEKALKHLDCVLKTKAQNTFGLKPTDPEQIEPGDILDRRCNQVEGNERKISLQRLEYAVIVDYTKKSDQRRMFLIPLQNKDEKIVSYYVAHGRSGETLRSNKTESPKLNSILNVRFFGNTMNGNASPTGLFVTGAAFRGHYGGDKKINSMILHGIESDVNDNTCQRAVIVHGSAYMKESGPKEGTHWMSSGCFMLDYDRINAFIEKLKGDEHQGGSAFFAYSPREAALADDFYCKKLKPISQEIPVPLPVRKPVIKEEKK